MISRVVLFGALLFFLGCSSQESLKPQPCDIETKHVRMSDEIIKLMHQLNMSIYDKEKSELEHDDIKRRYAYTMVDDLRSISQKLQDYGNAKLSKDLSGDELNIYLDNAKRLENDADVLEQIADNYAIEALPKQLEAIERSCNRCHETFRKEF